MAVLDHLILKVNDRGESVRFYRDVLGFAHEGDREPFAVLRVSPELSETGALPPWLISSSEPSPWSLSVERVPVPMRSPGCRLQPLLLW